VPAPPCLTLPVTGTRREAQHSNPPAEPGPSTAIRPKPRSGSTGSAAERLYRICRGAALPDLPLVACRLVGGCWARCQAAQDASTRLRDVQIAVHHDDPEPRCVDGIRIPVMTHPRRSECRDHDRSDRPIAACLICSRSS
jgi:hypothetical protein